MERLLTVLIICGILLYFSEKMIFNLIIYSIMTIEFVLAGIKVIRKKIYGYN